MIRRRFFVASLLILVGLVLSPGGLRAASTKEKLHKVEAALGQHKQEAEALDRKTRAASQNLEQLRKKLIAATAALQDKAAEADGLQDKLKGLAHDIAAKNAAMGEERKKLNALMEAFIELSRQPPESLLLHSQLTADYIHRAILLRTIVPRLTDEANGIADDIADLANERQQMTQQKRLVTAAQVNMEAQRRNLDQLIGARQGLLERTQAQKDAIARQLVALTSEAHNLHQLLEDVTPKRGGSTAVPRALRGSLRWPVTGRIVRGFGTTDADGVKSEGLTFAAPAGSPVVAPAAGRVVFAGPFKGYGLILILQHGGGYHSFLSGFGRIDVEMGEDVEAGEPLGVLPVADRGKPQFYFEWRHNNEPVNPAVNVRR